MHCEENTSKLNKAESELAITVSRMSLIYCAYSVTENNHSADSVEKAAELVEDTAR